MCASVCVCEREREIGEKERVCVWEREEKECVFVCVRERDEFLVKVSVHAGLEMVPRHAAALGMKLGDQKMSQAKVYFFSNQQLKEDSI